MPKPAPTMYPTLEGIPSGVAVRVYRDNVLLQLCASANAAFAFIARNQSSSVSHALRYEGYRCAAVCTRCTAFFAHYQHNPLGECDCPPCQGMCRCEVTQ